jgi:hypothetical protein
MEQKRMTEYEQTIDHSDEDEATFCEVHPDLETGLRCNKCNRYMCAECAVQTPIGYRCRECVRQVEDRYFKGTDSDYAMVIGICAATMAVAGAIMGAINFLFVALFVGLPTGAAIAGLALRRTGSRRGRNTAQYGAIATAVGGFIGGAIAAYLNYPDLYRQAHQAYRNVGREVPQQMLDVYPTVSTYVFKQTFSLTMLIFVGMAVYAVYYRMKS